jgi:glutaredoxin
MLSRLLGKLCSTPKLRRSPAEQQQVDAATRSLALYHFPTCPYCVRVNRAIKRLALQIELRDARLPVYRQELRMQGGCYQVPCLRIEQERQDPQWLYESRDIIAYLEQRFSRP